MGLTVIDQTKLWLADIVKDHVLRDIALWINNATRGFNSFFKMEYVRGIDSIWEFGIIKTFRKFMIYKEKRNWNINQKTDCRYKTGI